MIRKAVYIARALARHPKASKLVAARSYNQKYVKSFVPKAFDSSETAQIVYRVNRLPDTKSNRNLQTILRNVIRAKTGLKGNMPWKAAYHESKPFAEGLGPLGKRKTPLKGKFTEKDLNIILRAFTGEGI